MSQPIFARAKPSILKITETYRYHANISGNPTIDESGSPEGEIIMEVPLDGYKHLTRQAYADVRKQYQEISGDQFATLGHLAFTGIAPEKFWLDQVESPSRLVIPLQVDLPARKDELKKLIEDREKTVSWHTYRPDWPDVSPKPLPVKFEVDIYDERTFEDLFSDDLPQWRKTMEELTFERALIFAFRVDLALPHALSVKINPVLHLAQLKWPVGTSYHMLDLHVEPPSKTSKNLEWPYHTIFYHPENGSVEWRDVDFRPGARNPKEENEASKSTHAKNPHLYHAPIMMLDVQQPGELYQQPILMARLEIELPGVLLSDLKVDYFDAAGRLDPQMNIQKLTRILIDAEVNLKQRFDHKVLAPRQCLQFEGVILEDIRMADIANLLRDKGFKIQPLSEDSKEPYYKEESGSSRQYLLYANRAEGPDVMDIWVGAVGTLNQTERETVIPGGKTFKTIVASGNMELYMTAQLHGDVKKLTQVMNNIHTSLKERFRHVSTLE